MANSFDDQIRVLIPSRLKQELRDRAHEEQEGGMGPVVRKAIRRYLDAPAPGAETPTAPDTRESPMRPYSGLAEMHRPEWLVDHVLPVDSLILLNGPTGAYKSFLALDFALCIATGKAWNGRAVRQSDVVCLYSDNLSFLKLRLDAWNKHHETELDEQHHVFFCTGQIDLANPDMEDVDIFVASVQEHASDVPLIIIDSLESNCSNEDAVETILPKLAALREALGGASVLMVQNVGGTVDRYEATALECAVDTHLWISTLANRQEILLECVKQRNAVRFSDAVIEAKQVDLGYKNLTSCALVLKDESPA